MPSKRWWNLKTLSIALIAAFAIAVTSSNAVAQNNGGGGFGNGNNFGSVVGGIKIDVNGAISGDVTRLTEQQRLEFAKLLRAAAKDQAAGPGLRVISLKRLEMLLRNAAADETAIPLDAAYLGGLQRIETIVVVPDENDILIVGQGDDWSVNELGAVVGANNKQPVIQLQDLLVAMRTVDAANSGSGISVSIDPTEEGVQRHQQVMSQIRQFDPSMTGALQEAMGAQQISLTGIPTTSRFAQILVNADYKMKRLSMGLETAPIQKMPSVLEMIQARDASFSSMAPRFWMECNYKPVVKSEDGTVWQIHGQGVKTLTEDQYFDKNGVRKATGKPNLFAEKWAANMTEKFEELAAAEPAFAELRNIMDLTVVAAIIRKHDLVNQADTDISSIMGTMASVSTPEFTAPKTIAPQCSFIRTSNAWVVTTSGGVLVDSWGVASNVETNAKLSRESLGIPAMTGDSIWSASVATR